ncbi:hypothetical protein Nepgr_000615 [Nepenthes gracilis]|uniref:SAUR-like auxin-responsive protein family n=1 Tax=Nepenthes gracilis TaxID=150966 RepID=A0AAD3RWM4_NEPGR|nr:hypothetical protein Nepgr_000615 [Nepenthes gracilis]
MVSSIAQLRSTARKKKKKGHDKLKAAAENLQKGLLLLLSKKTPSPSHSADCSTVDEIDEADGDSSINVPSDVQEGHFPVTAEEEEEGAKRRRMRVVLPWRILTHRAFPRLLKEAAEDYGFDHGGALTITCPATELEKILANH